MKRVNLKLLLIITLWSLSINALADKTNALSDDLCINSNQSIEEEVFLAPYTFNEDGETLNKIIRLIQINPYDRHAYFLLTSYHNRYRLHFLNSLGLNEDALPLFLINKGDKLTETEYYLLQRYSIHHDLFTEFLEHLESLEEGYKYKYSSLFDPEYHLNLTVKKIEENDDQYSNIYVLFGLERECAR